MEPGVDDDESENADGGIEDRVAHAGGRKEAIYGQEDGGDEVGVGAIEARREGSLGAVLRVPLSIEPIVGEVPSEVEAETDQDEFC